MSKNPFIVNKNDVRDTFLGSNMIQEQVSATGVFLGRNIAVLRKFKLDSDYDDKSKGLKLGKPIYGFYVMPMAVKAMRIVGTEEAPIVKAEVEWTDEDENQAVGEIAFTPNDYFHFKKGMSDAQILDLVNRNNSTPIEQMICKSPYEATMLCNVLNRSAYTTLTTVLADLNSQRNMLSTAMAAMNKPYQKEQ